MQAADWVLVSQQSLSTHLMLTMVCCHRPLIQACLPIMQCSFLTISNAWVWPSSFVTFIITTRLTKPRQAARPVWCSDVRPKPAQLLLLPLLFTLLLLQLCQD
jgi:hypothetical protein